MRILCTIPGKFGDLLWSLATVRALAEAYGMPVDLLTSVQYGSILPLVQAQPYIGRALVDDSWHVQDTAPMTPRTPGDTFVAPNTRVYHLGYEGWPAQPLPLEHWRLALRQQQWYLGAPVIQAPELGRPWITVEPWTEQPHPVVVGFTDEHFELKFGLTALVANRGYPETFTGFVLAAPGSRWTREWSFEGVDWLETARRIAAAQVFLGCNSALHVLAVALGVPVVLMEPNPHRHHAIFYPVGDTGPQVTLVRGNDGQPTFDARHVADTLESVLSRGSHAPLSR